MCGQSRGEAGDSCKRGYPHADDGRCCLTIVDQSGMQEYYQLRGC